MSKTAECVTYAHPDKVCDQISDAILDEYLQRDSLSRVAVETMGGHGVINVCGEVSSREQIGEDEIQRIVESVYRDCGYTDAIDVIVNIEQQSREIARGVDGGGAGDQGVMVGYATSESPDLLPLEFSFARRLCRAMGARDGKAQVTINGIVPCGTDRRKPVKITVVTSVCGFDDQVRTELSKVVEQIRFSPLLQGGIKGGFCAQGGSEQKIVWLENPNGTWNTGGFSADTGLTGRKIVVDAYGPRVPVGGGAFSGKDSTKVDRSGAYMARRIAVDYLTRLGASEVRCELAYAIGRAEPVSAVVWVDGKPEPVDGYDLRPEAIIETLDLHHPIYRSTAKLGAFGNGFAWDNTFDK